MRAISRARSSLLVAWYQAVELVPVCAAIGISPGSRAAVVVLHISGTLEFATSTPQLSLALLSIRRAAKSARATWVALSKGY